MVQPAVVQPHPAVTHQRMSVTDSSLDSISVDGIPVFSTAESFLVLAYLRSISTQIGQLSLS